MAATVRSSTTYASAATEASSTVSMAAGWQAGDVMYIGWSLVATSGTVTTPSGWTAVVAGFASSSSTSEHAGTLRRVMQAGDPGTLAITHTSGRFTAVIAAVQGADGTTPEDGVTPTTDVNTSIAYPNIEYPSITPAGSADLLLLVGGTRNGINAATTTYNAITGFTLVNQATSSVAAISNSSSVIYSQQLSSNAATGTVTGTLTSSSGTTVNQTGQAIVIRPAGGTDGNVTGVGATVPVAGGVGTPAGDGNVTGVGATVPVASPAGTPAGGGNVTGVGAAVPVASPAGTPAGGANVTGVAAAVVVAGGIGVASGGGNANVTGVAAAVTVAAGIGTPTGGGTFAVARSTPTVADPRDGTATVTVKTTSAPTTTAGVSSTPTATAGVTSTPTVTDPRDGSATVS